MGLAEKLGLGSGAGTAPAKPHIEPQSALEKLIASIWAEVLRVEQVGLEDDFLALGGDSMLATQVISRIRDKLELEITVASFFDASTVKDQAGIIEELLPAARIRRRGGSGPAELSTAQKRIWLLHQFDPASPISNRPMALRLTRTLDRDALAQALNEIARRHEILRTVFPAVEGEARQVVLPAAAIPFETQDIRETAGETREKAAQRIASAEAIRPFDLANGPLARVKLLQLGSADHVLLILMHHIVFDGWSENVFVNELKQLYRAFALHQASPLPAPPIQYADFAAWQQRRLMDGAIDGQVEYWRKQLAGAPSALNLPSDFNAPAHPRWRGEARTLLLNSSVTEGLKRASREERVSLFMTLLATLQLLLARYADQEDIVIGVPVAGRNRVETEDLIGCFMNVLVLRTRVDAGLTVRQLLGRVRDAALGAFANQEVPFEKLVEEVRPERLPDRWPLFQTMFQLRNLPKRDSVEVEGLRFEPFEFDAGVIGGLDLSVEIREAPQGLRCSFRYDASLYGGETIERMMGHFENLLDGIVRARDQRVSKLPLLGDAERRRVLVDWNDTRVAFPQDTCIHHLFEAQAERAPEAIAVESEQGRLTYRDLNRRANQVARHLRGLGARPETIVAISMERSPELLAGLLGILKSGAAYLPLDPAHPKERLAYLVRDAGATMLLTQTSLLDRLPEVDRFVCLDADSGALSRESGQNPPRIESAENLAYVIYTSGTTGEPKGVMIQHRSVVNQLLWRQQYFPLAQNDRLLQRASIGFDDSVWELFEPLASGSTLVLARSRQDSDTHYLIDLIVRHQITAACFIPSLLDMLLEEPRFGECQSLRRVTTGAEVLPVDAPDRFFARVGASLINGYGPTEATIGCSYYRCETGTRLRSIPIGRPIANAEIYILDRDLEPSPIGVPGELFIGGAGLARGYLGQPDLTADKFIPHPFSAAGGARLYRTGDLARYLPDGNIEFLGRIDQQVKIRGYRIEPGEVEAVLAQHPSVRQAAVTVWEPRPGDKALAAYVVAREGSVITPSEARAFAHRRLPAYMIPSDWAVLDALPLQPNGKVNRVALPRPVRAAQLAAAPAEAPRNRLQAQLRRIWEDVLQIGDIGVRQNFFDLGGHSLLALKAFNLIERQLGLRLPLAALLAAPTIEMLAEAIEQKGYESSWASLVPIQPNGSRLPLYCVHGNDGDVLFYRDLALRLGEHQPLYGLQSPGLKDAAAMPATVEELAVLYVEEIRGVQPRGPYCLAGFCMGAYLALEMARQLQAQGERVALLAVVNTDGLWKLVRSFGGGLRFHWRNLSATEASRLGYLRGRMRSRLRSTADLVVNLTLAARIRAGRQIPQKLLARYVRARHVHASRQYWPAAPYRGDLLFLRGSDEGPGEYGAFWRRAVEGEIIGQMVPGKSIGVLREPNVLALAGKLGAALDAVQPAHDQRQVWDTIGVSRVRELEQQIQRVEQQLRLFQTISRFMVQEMSLQQVLQGIVSLVVEFMECDSCLLYLLDGDDLVLCATNAPHGRAVGSVRLNVNEGLTGWVARERTLLAISREAYRDPRFKRFQGLPEDDYESFLSAPVIARNRVVGVINVQHRESHAHTGREMEMLTTVGEQVGCLLVLARMDPGEIGEANHAGNVLASLTTVS